MRGLFPGDTCKTQVQGVIYYFNKIKIHCKWINIRFTCTAGLKHFPFEISISSLEGWSLGEAQNFYFAWYFNINKAIISIKIIKCGVACKNVLDT